MYVRGREVPYTLSRGSSDVDPDSLGSTCEVSRTLDGWTPVTLNVVETRTVFVSVSRERTHDSCLRGTSVGGDDGHGYRFHSW